MKKHHAGRIDSARLTPLVEMLNTHPDGLTTLEIDLKLRKQKIYNLNIAVSINDMRLCGYPVGNAKYLHLSKTGKKVYLYKKEK